MSQTIEPEYAVVNLAQRPTESWMEKGCYPTQILGVTQVQDQQKIPKICAVVEVSNQHGRLTGQPPTRKELLPTKYLREKCPQLLIKFYEDKITRA